MGIILGSNFDVETALPLDSREQVADLTARDAIDTLKRWEGMTVYVVSEQKTFKLVGGITNSDWEEASGGSGGGVSFQVITNADDLNSPYDITVDPGQLVIMYSFDGDVTVNLPDPSTVPDGWGVTIMRNRAENDCIVDAVTNGGSIEGEDTKELLYQWDKVSFVKLYSSVWGVF